MTIVKLPEGCILDENGNPIKGSFSLDGLVFVSDVPVKPGPEPEPETEPEPEPPSTGRPDDISRVIDVTDYFSFEGQYTGGSAYWRAQELVILRGDTYKLRAVRLNGSARQTFTPGEEFTLLCDGRPLVTATGEGQWLTFTFPAALLSEGWHTFDIEGHSCMVIGAYALKGDRAKPHDWLPVWTASNEFSRKDGLYHLRWIPARFDPVQSPLPAWDFVPFSEPVSKHSTIRRDLVPVREMDSHRPYQDSHGIWSAANRQRYTYDDSHRLLPRYPLLDGPRGVGNAHGVFHIQIGKGRVEDKPDSPLMGNVYFCDGWRVCRVDKTGNVTTLLGWRSKGPGHNWQEDPAETDQLELAGDWSAVQGPHGLREPWGFVFVEGSTAVDHNAAPIPAEDNRQPHLVGPRLLVADSQHNRVIQADFDAARHGVPPKVTEFLTGISDPWECVQWRDGLIVSERGSHRICEYDIHTRQFRRVIVSGPDLAYVQPSPSRWVIRTAKLEEIREHDCVAPEGLYVLGDWLYYASAAMAQVKRVHLVTGEIQWGCDILTKFPTGLKFAKVAVSDGTFGPEGTMFVPQWNNTITHAYLPGGERWIWGTGGTLAYDSAVAINEGRLVMGGCREGLVEYKLRAGETIDQVRYDRGEREYHDKGYALTHSIAGLSYTGEAAPFGVSEDMDYYLDHGKYMQ